jgi:predicted HicB family RNase H-like nuclease
MKETVTLRVYESTHKRLKIKAAKEKKTLIKLLEELSKKL